MFSKHIIVFSAVTLNESVTFRNGVLDVSVITKFPFYLLVMLSPL